MLKPTIRVMPARPCSWFWLLLIRIGLVSVRRYAIEVKGPVDGRYHPYVCGSSRQVDVILSELEPCDGELVFDIRRAA